MREIGQPENVVQTALVKSTVGLIEAGGHRFPANMRFFFLGRDGRATEVRW